jgi:hypothetical protein
MTRFFLYAGLLPLIMIPVWLAGGIYPPWQEPLKYLTGWAWLCFLLAPPNRGFPPLGKRLVNLLRDPATWCVLAFWGFLWLQSWNSGRIQTIDFDTGKYVYSPPPVAGLPGSFSPEESLEMLVWFVPVLSALLILRACRHTLSPAGICGWICMNGLANAGLAWWHLLHGWKWMYNRFYFGREVFSSFGYPNHAATYFLILSGLAIGLSIRAWNRKRNRRQTIWWAASAVVFLTTLMVIGSRAGVLFGILLLLGCAAGVYMQKRRQSHFGRIPHRRSAWILGTVVLLSMLLLVGIYQGRLNRTPLGKMQSRLWQDTAALRMWADYPFYGVGGWGYRYLVNHYKPVWQWSLRSIGSGYQPGREANVHNDFLQFLAEFGLVGMLLLTGSAWPELKKLTAIVRARFMEEISGKSKPVTPIHPMTLPLALTLGLVLLHSMIDLPFRSPAVFLHIVLLWTVLAVVSTPPFPPPAPRKSRLTNDGRGPTARPCEARKG